jgi:hypothetical protein
MARTAAIDACLSLGTTFAKTMCRTAKDAERQQLQQTTPSVVSRNRIRIYTSLQLLSPRGGRIATLRHLVVVKTIARLRNLLPSSHRQLNVNDLDAESPVKSQTKLALRCCGDGQSHAGRALSRLKRQRGNEGLIVSIVRGGGFTVRSRTRRPIPAVISLTFKSNPTAIEPCASSPPAALPVPRLSVQPACSNTRASAEE